MKKIINLVKLQVQMYLKGSSFIMPLITTAIFLYMMYSIKPLDIVNSYLVSSTFIFLLMVWIGLSVSFSETIVTEQILLLRVQSAGCYYTSKVFFLILIALFGNIIYIMFPVFQNWINGYDLFDRKMSISDVGNAFFLQGGCAFIGTAVGSFMHPRIIKNRKIAIALTVCLAVLSIVSTAITTSLPVLKGIFWILPPTMLPATVYGNAEFFEWGQTAIVFLVLFFYGMVLSILKSIICHKNKF